MEIIQTVNTQQATERLRRMGMKISPDTIRRGIQQRVFPFGDCVVTEKGAHCYLESKAFWTYYSCSKS